MDRPTNRTLTIAALAVIWTIGAARYADAQLRTVPYVTGLSSPVGMVQDPSDPTVQYVVEQGGLVRVIQNGTLAPCAVHRPDAGIAVLWRARAVRPRIPELTTHDRDAFT